MAGIFISYRHDDSQGFAGRLTDDLSDAFGPDQVFRDIEIAVGSDFTDVLHRAIAASDARSRDDERSNRRSLRSRLFGGRAGSAA